MPELRCDENHKMTICASTANMRQVVRSPGSRIQVVTCVPCIALCVCLAESNDRPAPRSRTCLVPRAAIPYLCFTNPHHSRGGRCLVTHCHSQPQLAAMLNTPHVLTAGLAMQPVSRTTAGNRVQAACHGWGGLKTPCIAARSPQRSTIVAGTQRAGSSNPPASKQDKKDRSHGCV